MKSVLFLLLLATLGCSKPKVDDGNHQDMLNEVIESSEQAENMAPDEEMGKDFGQYQVQKNDTLMLISFKIYGSIHRWKELKELNLDVFTHVKEITTGAYIKFRYPDKKFIWNIEGNPHLIHPGETLASISNLKYSTHKHWNVLFQNNRHLISDPDVIYAGFTIYTPNNPSSYQRSLASED